MSSKYAWHSIFSKIKPKERSTVWIEFIDSEGNSQIWTADYATVTVLNEDRTGFVPEKCFYIQGFNGLENYHYVPIAHGYYGVKAWRKIKPSEREKAERQALKHLDLD